MFIQFVIKISYKKIILKLLKANVLVEISLVGKFNFVIYFQCTNLFCNPIINLL